MAKERNVNPVQAQRKADKAREVKKGKAEAQDRRNEKLARKNPDRIQKQIDDLKAITTTGGKLSKHEEEVLAGLERDLKAVSKARDALGDKAPSFDRGSGGGWDRNKDRDGGQGGVLGKRRRDRTHEDWSVSDEDVPEDVRSIPMPRDTPPPISKEVMDEWYAKRRARWAAENPEKKQEQDQERERRGNDSNAAPRRPVVEAKTVYSAAPVSRDLRKEAVAAFVPTSVRMKMDKGQGQGGLIEPEEADKLEKEGYMKTNQPADTAGQAESSSGGHAQAVTMEEVEDDED